METTIRLFPISDDLIAYIPMLVGLMPLTEVVIKFDFHDGGKVKSHGNLCGIFLYNFL